MPNYVNTERINGILDQPTRRRARGIYTDGGVPNLTAEKTKLRRNHIKCTMYNLINFMIEGYVCNVN